MQPIEHLDLYPFQGLAGLGIQLNLVDPTIRTVEVKSGETTEITIENRPMRGYIQIVKKAADDNFEAEGSFLPVKNFHYAGLSPGQSDLMDRLI